MKNLISLTLLIVNLKGTPYGLTYDIYENYYDYETSENEIDAKNNVLLPKFITQPLNMIVNSGKTAKLPCIVDRLEGFVLLWKKNDQIISVGQQILDKHYNKYQIDPVKNGIFLLISSIDLTDEDKYTCAVSTVKKEEISHLLRVRIKPQIETHPKEVLTIQENDDLLLQCKVLSGTPIPNIRWRKCDGDVVGENETYRVANIDRSGAGCYSCEADNGYTVTPVTSEVTVIVQYAPEVTIQKSDETVNDINITCRVQSKPPANVVLYRDNRHGDRVILYSDRDNDSDVSVMHDSSDTTIYTLQLHDLDVSQFGDYNCAADNILGEDHSTYKLSGWPSISSVKISSDPPQSSCYKVTVHLHSETPVQTVKFFYSGVKSSYNVVPSQDSISHRQCHLSFSTQYSVYVSAANSYGFSPEIQYNFTTEQQSLINLPFSSATSFISSSCQILLILQLGLLMIPRL